MVAIFNIQWPVIIAPMMIAPIPPYLALINIFILPLTTTIAEDGLYLGYGINGFPSKWAAVFVPAFFYALQHSFIPTIFDVKFMTYLLLGEIAGTAGVKPPQPAVLQDFKSFRTIPDKRKLRQFLI